MSQYSFKPNATAAAGRAFDDDFMAYKNSHKKKAVDTTDPIKATTNEECKDCPPNGPEKSFPFQGYINRDQVGFHKEPRPGVDVEKDWIRNDFEIYEDVEVIGITANNWYKVRRKMGDATIEGYVDWRYVDRYGEHEFDEVLIERLSKESVQEKCDDVGKKLVVNYLAWNPFNLDYTIDNQEVFDALELLETYYRDYHKQDFTAICICLKDKGILQTIFSELNDVHIRQKYHIIARIGVFMPADTMIDTMEWFAIEEGLEEAGKALGDINPRDVLRYPTWSDPNPIDFDTMTKKSKQSMKDLMQDLVENQEEIFEQLDDILGSMMELKAEEIAQYWEAGRYGEVERIILEMNDLAEAGLEMLFSTDPQNKYANRQLIQLIKWAFDEYLKTDLQMPTIYLDADPTKPLDKYFDATTGQLIPQSVNAGNSAKQAAQQASPVTGGSLAKKAAQSGATKGAPKNADAELQAQAKHFVKEMIVREAELVHLFFYEEMPEIAERCPGLQDFVSNIFTGQVRQEQYDKLSPGVDLDDSDEYQDLSAKQINSMTWMDLARIWMYELGDSRLGRTPQSNYQQIAETDLLFGKNATTTKAIINHPGTKALQDYAVARAKHGNFSNFTAQVKYDTSSFWKAMQSNDVTLNFLGSFLIIVEVDKSLRVIKFTAYNQSSRVSATRFRRDPNKDSNNNKIGIFENKERSEGNNNNDIPLGGTLTGRWEWTTQF